MRAAVVTVFAMLVGCRHVPVYATAPELARHREQFAITGFARVNVEQGGTHSVAAVDRVVVTIPGNQRSHLWGFVRTGRPTQVEEVTIGTLVSGCDADARGADCLAARVQGMLRVGKRRELDPAMLGVGAFGALGVVVGGTCLAICNEPNVWAYVGTAIATVVMLVPLATVQ